MILVPVQVQPLNPSLELNIPQELMSQDLDEQKEWIWQHQKDAVLNWLQVQVKVSPVLQTRAAQAKAGAADTDTAAVTMDEEPTKMQAPLQEKPEDKVASDGSGSSTRSRRRIAGRKSHPSPAAVSAPSWQRYQLDLLQRLTKVQQQLPHPTKIIKAIHQRQRHAFPPRTTSLGSFLLEQQQHPNTLAAAPPTEKLLQVLLDWTGCNYGLIARISSRSDTAAGDPCFRLQPPLCASRHVKVHGGTQKDGDKDSFVEDDDPDFSDDSSDSDDKDTPSTLTTPPFWPITTYGPVWYQRYSGSITLMMDQIRFESALPLLSTKTSERANEQDDDAYNDSNASLEKSMQTDDGTVELLWTQVAKYQTTKPSSSKHLFRLVLTETKQEYVFQLPTRQELERLVVDVKNRTVGATSKKAKRETKKKRSPTIAAQPQHLRQAQPPRRPNRLETPKTPAKPQIDPPRQPTRLETPLAVEKANPLSEMMGLEPPSMPVRKNSHVSSESSSLAGGDTSVENIDGTEDAEVVKRSAPTLPLRRASTNHSLPEDEAMAATTVSQQASSEKSPPKSAQTTAAAATDIEVAADTPPGSTASLGIGHSFLVSVGGDEMWSVDDVLPRWTTSGAAVGSLEPLYFAAGIRLSTRQAQKRRSRDADADGIIKRQFAHKADGGANDDNQRKNGEDQPEIALLPRAWQAMVAVPVQWRGELQGIVVLAKTKQWDRTRTPVARAGSSSVGSLATAVEDSKQKDDNIDRENVILQQQQQLFTKDQMSWWAPLVSGFCHEFLQHDAWQEQCGAQSQALKLAEQKLIHAVQLHRHMLHAALPPPALRLLHVDLNLTGHQSATSNLQGSLSLTDVSDLHGSVTSRYGLMVGGTSGADDSCSILTTPPLIAPKRPKIQRSKTQETAAGKLKLMTRLMPRRCSSSDNFQAIMQQMDPEQSGGNTDCGDDGVGITRVDPSKRGRPGGLMRQDEAEKSTLTKIEALRPGIPRLNSLRSFNSPSAGSKSKLKGEDRMGNQQDSSLEDSRKSWMSMYSGEDSLGICDLHTASNDTDDQGASTQVSFRTVDSKFGNNPVASMDVMAVGPGFSRQRINVQALYAGKNPNVSFVFLSIVNFQEIVSQKRPLDVMNILARLFFKLDKLCEKYGTVRLDDTTISGAYVAAAGLFSDEDEDNGTLRSDDTVRDSLEGSLPTPGKARERDKSAAVRALAMAKDMITTANSLPLASASQRANVVGDNSNGTVLRKEGSINVRIGIHIGDTMYGVIGQSLPRLNCISNAIRTSARLQEVAQPNCICVSKAFHDLVGDAERGWDPEHQNVDTSHAASLLASGSIVLSHNQSSTTTILMSGVGRSQHSSTASQGMFGATQSLIAYNWRSPAATKLDDASNGSSLPSLSNYSASHASFAASFSETTVHEEEDGEGEEDDDSEASSGVS